MDPVLHPTTATHPPLEDSVLSEAIQKSLGWLERTQGSSGAWPGDYGGPMFLLPLFVATTYAIKEPLDDATRDGMLAYLTHHQNADGGFGLHVEAKSSVFPTALNYVALRLLGVPASDQRASRARHWLHTRGDPTHSASWGKFFLALLGLYDYRGMNPVSPELWLLPETLPIHPARLWCHCRMVYLPMSYLYARRLTLKPDPLLLGIRDELYTKPFDSIDWEQARTRVHPDDAYVALSPWMKRINRLLAAYERRPNAALRQRALSAVLEQIRHEDRNTNFICLGPINKLLNTLVWHFEAPSGEELEAHRARLRDYLFRAEDGIKMQGYNSSELWDTAFAVQAVAETGLQERYPELLAKANRYLEQNQVIEDVRHPAQSYRHPSKGGFPFSTRAHGWPISDCTAEGVKAALLSNPYSPEPISKLRLEQAVEFMLSMQNPDGGWATYEPTRGPRWLERLNPSDCFARIMIDYSYVECTSACVQALAAFRQHHPGHRRAEISQAIDRGRRFILQEQRVDGSWEGSWGVCFTYGAFFGVWGLLAAGCPESHPALKSASQFLLTQQLSDGGWGESIESCRTGRYVSTPQGQAVMTAWALLALLRTPEKHSPAVQRGLAFLTERQLPDGSFPGEGIAGVFNKTTAIHYDNYLKIFPLWALALARMALAPGERH